MLSVPTELLEAIAQPAVVINLTADVLFENAAARALRPNAGKPTGLQAQQRATLQDALDLIRASGPTCEAVKALRSVSVSALGDDQFTVMLREPKQQHDASRSLMFRIIDMTPAVIFAKDLEGRFTLFNRPAHEALKVENVLGRTYEEVFPDSPDIEQVRVFDATIMRTGLSRQRQTQILVDGTPHYFWTQSFPIFDEDGNVDGIAGISSDITDRVNAQTEIRERELRFRLAFDHASGGMALLRLDGRFQRVNASLTNALGYESDELIGLNIEDFLHEQDTSDFMSTFRGRSSEPSQFDVLFRHKDGRPVVTEFSASTLRTDDGDPIEVVAHIVDVTQRRQLQERARQAERIDLISQLTSGIAHDLNNVLSVILGHADFIGQISDDPEILEDVEGIATAAKHAGTFTQRLLSYTRQQTTIGTSLCSVDDIVREVATMLGRSVPTTIEIELDLNARGVNVRGDATQLQSAVLNLGINARDAITDSGKITLRTMVDESSGEPTVSIVVEDDGIGLSPDDQRRVFEPFFTTKTADRGTGLGLPSVVRAAHAHGGSTLVTSEEGQGSAFSIRLPIVASEPISHVSDAEISAPETHVILVVDDDSAIRRLLTRGLERRGFEVIQATDGLHALEQMRLEGPRVDAVIFDLKMPRMGGLELSTELKTAWPGLPLVLISGNVQDPDALQITRGGEVGILQKPFHIGDIVEQLHELWFDSESSQAS